MVVYFWEISIVGRIYEGLIAIVKSSLKKVVGKAKLNYDKIVTIVTEIQGCLNSRPSTYLNEENVYDLLTSNHLVYEHDINANIIDHFLKRCMTDYMLALQELDSYQRRRSSSICVLKVNDIVLVKDNSAPRLSWRKGKVEKSIFGDDNLVREADVRVYQDNLGKTIVICRPLRLLVPLEVTNIIHNHNELNKPAN